MLNYNYPLKEGMVLICMLPNYERHVYRGDKGIIEIITAKNIFISFNNNAMFQRWSLDEVNLYLEPFSFN